MFMGRFIMLRLEVVSDDYTALRQRFLMAPGTGRFDVKSFSAS
jgi:hypothetical protein